MPVDWSEAPREAGAVVVVAGSGVNLRSGPGVEDPVLASLALGTELKVLSTGGEATIAGRPERWLEVEGNGQRGWIFGAGVSDLWFDADLDRDGSPERLVVVWANDQHLQVRLREGDAVRMIDLGTFADIEGPLLRAEARLVTEAPLPLLEVVVVGREMCASGTSTMYVGYAKDLLNEPFRLIQWADAPYWTRAELRWERRGAVVTTRSGGDTDEKGRELQTVTEERYTLREGALVKQSG